jgi:hypothetical protein
MRRALWLMLGAAAASCSSRDETLGETLPPLDPIVEPRPTPDVDPQPQPQPDPDPKPMLLPCEDASIHLRTGECMRVADCHTEVITRAGYECDDGNVCCEADAVGCGQFGCGGGGTTSQAGAANAASDAGAGGAPQS